MEKLNKTRAFLTEFIIVILFFSVAAVIAIGLYVEANRKNDESVLKSCIIMQVQSVAENIRSGETYYGTEGIYTEYLDADMCIVSEEAAAYVQKIIVSHVKNENMTAGDEYQYEILISEVDSKEELYTLTLRQYVSGEVQ